MLTILINEKTNLWERLLLSFIAVELFALFFKPMSISFMTSAVDLTGCILASGTAKPFGWEWFNIPSVCANQGNQIA
jgi:hypothetical protein